MTMYLVEQHSKLVDTNATLTLFLETLADGRMAARGETLFSHMRYY